MPRWAVWLQDTTPATGRAFRFLLCFSARDSPAPHISQRRAKDSRAPQPRSVMNGAGSDQHAAPPRAPLRSAPLSSPRGSSSPSRTAPIPADPPVAWHLTDLHRAQTSALPSARPPPHRFPSAAHPYVQAGTEEEGKARPAEGSRALPVRKGSGRQPPPCTPRRHLVP